MKKVSMFLIFFFGPVLVWGQLSHNEIKEGFEVRIRQFVDTLKVFSTHEHFIDPELVRNSGSLDFSLLFLENGFNDLVSSGMNDSILKNLSGNALDPSAKWEIIEPFWNNAFNTANNRVMVKALNDLYHAPGLNSRSVIEITSKMKSRYGKEWFDSIILERSGIDHIIIDGDRLTNKAAYIKYSGRFDPWITVSTKHVIDSLAISQDDPIYTLEDFVKSMSNSFIRLLNDGMVAVNIDMHRYRSIKFEKAGIEAAKKIFRTLVNGDEDTRISPEQARPLQDYMVYHLLSLAANNDIPVAFNTGLQPGNSNKLSDSNPLLLSNLFKEFPTARFVLFHGGYPFGGEMSVLAKNFSNVYVDMSWLYNISPTYSNKYLGEFLETVPVSKIMAFGGNQRTAEMTYGSLVTARKIIADVLIEKVRSGFFTEEEALNAARLILHDNAMKFYLPQS